MRVVDFGNGWQLTRDQRLMLCVLDWLYDRVKGRADEYVRLDVGRLMVLAPAPRPTTATFRVVIDDLLHDRVLSYTRLRHAEHPELPAEVSLTREGVAAVESLRRHREDPAARRPAARDAVLRWLYERAAAGDTSISTISFGLSEYARFLSAQLSFFIVPEVDAAVSWLEEAGYLTAARGPNGRILTLAITKEGEWHVESGRPTNHRDEQKSTLINNGIMASNGALVTANSVASGVQSVAAVQNTTQLISPAQIAPLLDQFIAELKRSGRPDGPDLSEIAGDVRAELMVPAPRLPRLKALMSGLAAAVAGASSLAALASQIEQAIRGL